MVDLFVLTYNRAHFIKDTIANLLNQTFADYKLTVFDNGSTDNTKEVVDQFREKVKYVGSDKNHGSHWNFQRAIEAASEKYTVLFHDEDMLYPRYLEYAIDLLERDENINVVGSGMKNTKNPVDEWSELRKKYKVFDNAGSFAAFVNNGFPMAYNSVVYRTKAMKKVSSNIEVYGKINDRPFVFDAIGSGKGAMLLGQFVQYRVHEGQDSKNNKTGPFCQQTLMLHKKYYDLIFSQGAIFDRLMYESNVYLYMKDEYKRLPENENMSFDEYANKALDMGIVTAKTILFGKFLNIVKYSFIKRAFRLLRKSFFQYS